MFLLLAPGNSVEKVHGGVIFQILQSQLLLLQDLVKIRVCVVNSVSNTTVKYDLSCKDTVGDLKKKHLAHAEISAEEDERLFLFFNCKEYYYVTLFLLTCSFR